MNYAPSVRTIARENNVDIAGLIEILQQRRPAHSTTEQLFVENTLDVIPGMLGDDYGNRLLYIGEKPTILWSCHTDTVSKDGGRQNIRWKGDLLELNGGKPGQSLGADDGAGLWLLLEMIKAGKPGLYIFHREEEIGGLGSAFITRNHPEWVAGIQMAIAFDRRGTTSVITRQSRGKCCSSEFADALCAKLGPTFEKDPTGTFTDTANYMDLVPECTNISIGYQNEHGPRETLDVAYLIWLRNRMLEIDLSDLPIKRDPKAFDDDDWYGFGYGNWYGGTRRSSLPTISTKHANDGMVDMVELVKERPYTVAHILKGLGYSPQRLEKEIEDYWLMSKSANDDDEPIEVTDEDLDLADYTEIISLGDDVIVCFTCDDEFGYVIQGFEDRCPECGGEDVMFSGVSLDA